MTDITKREPLLKWMKENNLTKEDVVLLLGISECQCQ